MTDTIIAVFASESEATQARSALLSNGFSESQLTISANFTGDGIAAEAPGQAYENQPTKKGTGLRRLFKTGFASGVDEDTADARRMADVQRGTVVLSVGPIPRAECERAVVTLKLYRPVAIRH